MSKAIPPTSILVVDNFLSDPFTDYEIDKIISLRDAKSRNWYNWLSKEAIPNFSSKVATIYHNAISYVGLDESEIVGVETWANQLELGDFFHMHSDIDEVPYIRTRRMRSAILGLVYFADCKDLQGGNIIFDDGVYVGARTNRCVLFFGGTPHAIDRVEAGTRKSLVMSIWDEVPLGYRKESTELKHT